MKLGYLSLIFLFFTKGCLFAQATFSKTIDFSNGDEGGLGVTQKNDGYILIGAGWGFEIGDYFDQKLKFAKTDLEGNVIWTNFLGEPTIQLFCSPQAGIVTQDENIVFCGSRLTGVSYSVILVKFSPDTGDTIFYKRFAFDDQLKGFQVEELSDGNLLILAEDENDAYGSILIKTTSTGEFIWEKRYGNTNEIAAANFAIINDTIYLISRNLFCIPEGYKIRVIDSDGIIIQEQSFDEGCPSMGILSNQEGFYGVGATFPVPPYQSYIYRTDVTGQIQWQFNTTLDLDTLEYEDLILDIVRELPNGDLVVGGYFASNYLGTYFGLISKVSLLGEAYWERIYTSSSDLYDDSRLVDIQIGSEGEIILVGAGFGESDMEDQNFWLLKLDSMGCLVPGCDTLSDAILEFFLDETAIIVYPNPTSTESIVQVTLYEPTYLNEPLEILLMDISGGIIFKNKVHSFNIDGNKIRFPFQCNNLMPGIYLIQINCGNKLFGIEKVVIK